MESLYEVAVYLHSFLNLDLFSQGFYAIKIRCRLDDGSQIPVLGVPSRVVQYGQVEEADPSRVADSVWRLEEADKSFCSRIFWIKYARQEVPLQEMVAFSLAIPAPHGPPSCGFTLVFDLLHSPANKELPKGIGWLAPPEAPPSISSQSFRIVPSACNGLHSYCGVQFDTLHLSLVNVTVHCTLLDIQKLEGGSCMGDGGIPLDIRKLEAGSILGNGGIPLDIQKLEGGSFSGDPGIPLKLDDNSGQRAAGQTRESRVNPAELLVSKSMVQQRNQQRDHQQQEQQQRQQIARPSFAPSFFNPKHLSSSKMLDSMLASVLPHSPRAAAEPVGPSKSWRRKKPKSTLDPPIETDLTAVLGLWTDARDKLQAELDAIRTLLSEQGVEIGGAVGGPTVSERELDGGETTAWEWSARVMRKSVKGLWNELLEVHREQPHLVTEHLRVRWRDSRAAEWATWTVNPDAPVSPAGSFSAWRANYYEQRSRKGRSRFGPSDVSSARTADAHRKGIGDGGGCLLQDLSLYRHPERHPILSTERHVATQRRSTSLSHFRPTLSVPDSSPGSSRWSFRSTPPESPADSSPLPDSPADSSPPQDLSAESSPPSSPPPESTPRLRSLTLPQGVTYEEERNAALPSSVKRFFAETAPMESYEMLMQEMARVSPSGVHVVVFVHGFQGHHLDLRLLRDHWLVLDPSIEPLMSRANEDLTFEPIQDMGARLAAEVAEFLTAAARKPAAAASRGRSSLSKLSFVGHSLGNLIIRSALTQPVMEPFLGRLHTFLSVSGPHLGYLYSGNTLFNSGLWFMKRFKNSACMYQLTFSDREDIRECYLYRLNQARTLDLFRNVILVASPQDRYVPYHSARVEMCSSAIKDLKRGPAYAAMILGCLGKLAGSAAQEPGGLERSQTLLRCDVYFDTTVPNRSISSMLGRAAHIELLENDVYIRCLLWTHKDCFL